jgi:hypothetical protein
MEKSDIIGDGWKQMWAPAFTTVAAPWTFKEDGSAIQGEKQVGEWWIQEDMLVIKFTGDMEDYGFVVLSCEDKEKKNYLRGENRIKAGSMHDWVLMK